MTGPAGRSDAERPIGGLPALLYQATEFERAKQVVHRPGSVGLRGAGLIGIRLAR
jgi:hypothetical protein